MRAVPSPAYPAPTMATFMRDPPVGHGFFPPSTIEDAPSPGVSVHGIRPVTADIGSIRFPTATPIIVSAERFAAGQTRKDQT
ncbi:hypothetical protein GCM10022223_11160 [Kineosporia mesophila]|uniref:Uncharacterized protein n=1 Tax=Kineosporia mesophila TaxID=566012 RepID=A0ABP6Z513_9ACTN